MYKERLSWKANEKHYRLTSKEKVYLLIIIIMLIASMLIK